MTDNAVDCALSIRDIRKDDIIIAFMGPTGTGKSNFIDLLTGQIGHRAGHTLKSATSKIQATRVARDGYGDRIVLVDTPGFDDTTRSDMEILSMISDWLAKTYRNDIKLSGIVYLHRITDNRLSGSPYKNLRMFGNLCGDDAASRVVLVSTMWQRLVDQKVGETREIELRKQFWNNFIDKGSGVDRLRTSAPDEAWRIVTRMITGAEAREAVLLQEEVVTIGLKLNETEAGKTLYTGLQRLLADQKEALEALLDKAKESSDSQLKKDLEREIKKIQQQFDRTFAETSSMKISFGRRILLLLFGRRSRAKTIKIGEFNN